MQFEKVWVEQCKATKAIKRRFGAKSALDYLIGEKLVTFADAARDDPGFARELPRFLAPSGGRLMSTSLRATSRAENQPRETACDNSCTCAEHSLLLAPSQCDNAGRSHRGTLRRGRSPQQRGADSPTS